MNHFLFQIQLFYMQWLSFVHKKVGAWPNIFVQVQDNIYWGAQLKALFNKPPRNYSAVMLPGFQGPKYIYDGPNSNPSKLFCRDVQGVSGQGEGLICPLWCRESWAISPSKLFYRDARGVWGQGEGSIRPLWCREKHHTRVTPPKVLQHKCATPDAATRNCN